MSELAFDREGNPFRFSRRTKKLRPRRWKNAGQRGTCAAVLDPDGEPLFIDADAEYVEFRTAVGGVPGFYRLDQCDGDGTPIEDVPPAYLSIESARNVAPTGDVDPRDAIIRDLAQINADMTRTIAERFSSVMQATADVLRAADGAGLSRRQPVPPPPPPPAPAPEESGDEEDEDDDEIEPAPPANPFGPLQPFVEMAMPHLPKFGAFLWVKFQEFMTQNATPTPATTSPAVPASTPPAAPSPGPGGAVGSGAASTAPAPPASPPPAPAPPASPPPTSMSNTDAVPAADALGGAVTVAPVPNVVPPPVMPSLAPRANAVPAADTLGGIAALEPSGAPAPDVSAPSAPAPSATPGASSTALPVASSPADAVRNAPPAPTTEQWAHLRAILARLSPREVAITETVIARMPPEVRMSWLAELSALEVDQAAEAVRSMIPKPTPAKPQTANPTMRSPAVPATTVGEAPANAPAAPPRPGNQPSLSPQAMDHFLAIQAALTPEESASVRAAANALSPLELCALVDEFSAMSVPEAVARVRALLAGATSAAQAPTTTEPCNGGSRS